MGKAFDLVMAVALYAAVIVSLCVSAPSGTPGMVMHFVLTLLISLNLLRVLERLGLQ